jgi:K+-transporting ATPase KdpF subunit
LHSFDPTFHREVTHGFHISDSDPAVLRPFGRPGLWLRTPEEVLVSIIYLISASLVALIFVYLIAALLYPEKF